MKKILILFTILYLSISVVFAEPLPPPSITGKCLGIKFTVKWKEPKYNVDGTNISLQKSTLYFSVNGTIIPTATRDYKATSPNGGGAKEATFDVLMNCKTTNIIKIWVTTTDTNNIESMPSEILPLKTEYIDTGGIL